MASDWAELQDWSRLIRAEYDELPDLQLTQCSRLACERLNRSLLFDTPLSVYEIPPESWVRAPNYGKL